MLVGVAALGIVTAVVIGFNNADVHLFPTDECSAEVDGHRVELSQEQAENASLITAISVRRGLPARAASIALATAYQESDLFNLEHGDRDSVGLFQQRPSTGLGLRPRDPRPGLRDQRLLRRPGEDRRLRVDGDHRCRPGGAAVRLPGRVRRPRGRRSGDRLGAHRTLAGGLQLRDLRRRRVRRPGAHRQRPDRARRVRTPRRRWGSSATCSSAGSSPAASTTATCPARPTTTGGRSTSSCDRSAAPTRPAAGRWRSTSWRRPTGSTIQTVIFDDRIWTARQSDQGWRDYDPPSTQRRPDDPRAPRPRARRRLRLTVHVRRGCQPGGPNT